MAHASVTCRPPRAQQDSAGQLERLPGNVLSAPEGQPVTAFGRALLAAHKAVQAGYVDELKAGQIDDQTLGAGRSRVELAVEQRCRSSVKRPTEPDDQRGTAAVPANHQLPWRNRLMAGANVVDCTREAHAVGRQASQLERRSCRATRCIALAPRRATADCAAGYP
ncbi:MAG: hypothetical protein QOG59_831 [Solirubrobacteraceae bacterium]|nr:hypothetical protein [Solirubrobacteraceae bacterium]